MISFHIDIHCGMTIWGTCDGYFGRDFYESNGCRVENFGDDWVVVRKNNGFPAFATFDSQEEMVACLRRWHDAEGEYNK